MKRVLLAGAALGCAAVLTGCNAARPGAAATVGNGRISVDDMANRVDAIYTGTLASENTRAQVQLLVLDGLIQSRIDDSLSASYGVTVSDQQVDAAISQVEGQRHLTDAALETALLSSSPAVGYVGLHDYVHDFLVEQALRTKIAATVKPTLAELEAAYVAGEDTNDSADISVIVVKDAATAATLVRQLKANPASFATVAMAQSLDTQTKSNGGDLGAQQRGTLPAAIESLIYAGKANDIIGPLAQSDGSQAILKVNAITAPTFEQELPQLLSDASSPTGSAAVAELKAQQSAVATKLGVWINPRFGQWGGAKSLTGVASPALLSTISGPSSSDTAANTAGGGDASTTTGTP